MSELPTSWSWVAFSDVATIDSNLVDPADYPDLPHIAPNHIEAYTGRLLPYVTVAEDGVTSSKHHFHSGHILYSKIRPYLTKVVRVGFDGLCSADMYPISTAIDAAFLRYWMLTPEFTASAAEHQGRSVLPKINQNALKKLPIPLPPISEQERIVAAIEEHFSHLDAAEASLHRAKHNLDRLRSSALASMFSSGWKRSPLVELAADDRPICYGILKPKTEQPGVVPYVEVRSIQNGEIDVESLHRTTQELHDEFRRSELREGDVVFAVRGSWDRAAVVPAELAGANVSRDVARVSPDPTKLRAVFLNLFLHSPEARRFFAAHARGVAVKGVNIGDLRQLPTPAPSLDEQDAMVARAQDEEEHAQRVAAEVTIANRRAGQLRRAILAAAFSGQLVPEDPADEPASVLLDRIRAEAPAEKKSTRKKSA